MPSTHTAETVLCPLPYHSHRSGDRTGMAGKFMNPCDGNHPGREVRPREPWTPDQRRVCWLYHNDPAYRQAWGGPPELPGSVARAISFLGAAARHLIAGLPQAAPEELRCRLALCGACPHLVEDRCAKCGC